VIFVKGGKVLIRDLKSRNRTFVNGKPVEEDLALRTGDKLQIGPLAFEVLIDHSLGGEKKPKVKSVKEAAARTTASGQDTALIDEGDISDWLEEADEVERQQRLDPETRQLKLDETDQVTLQKEIERRTKERKERREEVETKELEETKKKGPGKLPKLPDRDTKDSGEAAAEVLRKFFNSR
jgi:pSer/pThr/pTyr-binding forkhead associated (FHA) protein